MKLFLDRASHRHSSVVGFTVTVVRGRGNRYGEEEWFRCVDIGSDCFELEGSAPHAEV